MRRKTKLPRKSSFPILIRLTEKYATLKGDRLPITVEERNTPVARRRRWQQRRVPIQPARRARQPAKTQSDIHYIMTELTALGRVVHAAFPGSPFSASAHRLPPYALALLAFVGIAGAPKKERGTMLIAKQMAALRREQHDLMKTSCSAGISDQAAFYDAAIRYIQIAAARASHQNPESIGACGRHRLRLHARCCDQRQRCNPFSTRMGSCAMRVHLRRPAGNYPTPRRREVLETLRKFENANE